MIKILIGFLVFAALALFVIFKGGDNLDMSGEKHGADAVHAPADAKPADAKPQKRQPLLLHQLPLLPLLLHRLKPSNFTRGSSPP